jgi:TadE-like protein
MLGDGRSDAGGQSTVELALCLPALALVLGFVVEVGLVASEQARLWHAAREAARVAVVDPDESAVSRAAARSGLGGIKVTVHPDSGYRVAGRPLEVALSYRPKGHVPLVGELFDDLELNAQATMRIEEP